MSNSNSGSDALSVFECHDTLQHGAFPAARPGGRPSSGQLRSLDVATSLQSFECTLDRPADAMPAPRPPAQPRSIEFVLREKLGAMSEELRLLRTEVARLQKAVELIEKQGPSKDQ